MTARLDEESLTSVAMRSEMRARRSGLMRYDADRLSVVWTNAALLVTLLPWLVPIPLWARIALSLPVIYLRSSCAYIQHNQGHLPVFWSKTLNFLLDIELALLTGYVTPLWELQHARGHHRHYLSPERDPASIIDITTGKPLPRWKYCIRGNLEIIGHSWRIAAEETRRGRADARPRMVAEFLVAAAICVALCVANPVNFIALILIPNVLISFFVWHISYDHHHDVPGTSHYDASHTHVDVRFNWSRFNIGHHAAHHEKPTLHWSLLPQRTAAILDQLDPRTLHGADQADATAAD